jgi:hypothetical protein
MNKLTIIRYTFEPYFDGYFENGLFYDSTGKPLKTKVYNGCQCIYSNNKRYGVKTLRKNAKKQEVELVEIPF